jgi:restriction endonuclease Mrr
MSGYTCSMTSLGRIFVGAAPIGLIDGEKLLDLLFKYDIGVKKRSISLYEIDEEYLKASDDLSQLFTSLRAIAR